MLPNAAGPVHPAPAKHRCMANPQIAMDLIRDHNKITGRYRMADDSFHIVYRGISDEMADRLERQNVIRNAGLTSVTLRFWRACDLNGRSPGSRINLMAISLPKNARMLIKAGKVALERDLTLKCIGKADFKKILTPDGTTRDIRMFAMEMME